MAPTAREFGDELLRTLLEHAVDGTPGAVGAGLSIGGREGHRVVAAVGVAADLDRQQLEAKEGPVVEALTSGTVVSGAAQFAGVEAVGGVVVTPGEWGSELPVVLSTYLGGPPDDDTLGTVDRWESLLSQALAVVEYCAGEEVRAEQMLQMIQYRRVVEQAKGCLMAVTGADAQTAFSVLSRASQHFNVRLRTLAIALVEHVGAGEVEHPEDPEAVVRPSERERRVAAQVWEAMKSGGKIGEGADGASA